MQENREQKSRGEQNQPPEGQPAVKSGQQSGHEQAPGQQGQQAGQQSQREREQGAQMGQGSQGQRRQQGQGEQGQQGRQQGQGEQGQQGQQQQRQQGQENLPAARTKEQGGQSAPLSGLVEQGRHIRHDAQALTMSVGESAQLFSRYMTEQVEQRPYTTLGVALGVGYLLGGGLATRITGTALGTAYRLALALAARELSQRVSIPGISTESADSGRFSS